VIGVWTPGADLEFRRRADVLPDALVRGADDRDGGPGDRRGLAAARAQRAAAVCAGASPSASA
jgi:hypothetical protein